ncbi:F-box only protein 6-like [Rhineura floridana]|uniref:F-box only protein 6-like n=1 Tax=Rhineura floridana TaxID=261503 RepID=UPI002AC8206F|nr:F-box only protein 6-like [Rhineura floridana]
MANIRDLPEDILLDILTLVPLKDLILNCRLVCTQWRNLVDLPVLWKRIYQRKDIRCPLRSVCYILSHLEKNLVKNPCGEEGLDCWEIKTPSSGQWKIQQLSGKASMRLEMRNFHQRRPAVQDGLGHRVTKCFSACNGLCIKSQLITLKDEGYWDELMDRAKPNILVTDWFYCRQGSQYRLHMKLLSADFQLLREFCTDDMYMQGWKHGRWRKVCYILYKCAGVRHIVFEHQGQNVNGQPSRDRGMQITKSSIMITKC